MIVVNTPVGKVYLVGAGPGDPKLLTLRGRECLEQASVVIYDYLAMPDLLKWVPEGVECICLGRHGTGRMMAQDEVNRLMVDRAIHGQVVVRLKGGDPVIFGRLAEEAAALTAAGIAYEVVPGVTAALAAGAYAGVTLTHRDEASCVAFVTGHQCANNADKPLDFSALAKFPGTLVFYMGVTSAGDWSSQLIDHGMAPEMRVKIVRRISWPEQQSWTSTLADVGALIEREQIRPPVLSIVGPTVGNTDFSDWFTTRPLFGQTVLVTRPAGQGGEMIDRLETLGAKVLVQPAIEISEPDDWSKVDRAIKKLQDYDWLVFSSRNGVEYFLNRLAELSLDLRALGGAKLAAIGSATAAALAEYHLKVDLLPDEYRAEALVEALVPEAAGKRFLLLRASRGREVLAETLLAAGADVEQVVVYKSTDVTKPNEEVAAALRAGEIDWTTATSSAIARSLVALFGGDLTRTQLAAISPLTAGVLDELGCKPTTVASDFTAEGVIAAILAATK